jgi:hypothetical protein
MKPSPLAVKYLQVEWWGKKEVALKSKKIPTDGKKSNYKNL